MDSITPEQARADMEALGLPQVVLDAFDGAPIPEPLTWHMRASWELLWDFPEHQHKYFEGRITPLWTDHTGHTIVAYRHDGEKRGFFRFFLELPEGEEECDLGLSWPQILVRTFVDLYESEVELDEIRTIAALVRFDHVDRLLNELENTPLDTDEAYEAWHDRFASTLPRLDEPGGMP
jgi:hypothetical protein